MRAIGLFTAGFLISVASTSLADPPRNVILFVGDGMAHEAIKASGCYFNGGPGQFNFERFGGFGWMTHNDSRMLVTDSASSATAMATGYKVDPNVLSLAIASGPDPRSATPNDGRPLQTLLELFKSQGKSTGLVTSSFMTDATPGAFGSHVGHRSNTAAIAEGYFNDTQPNVLFGGGGSDFNPPATYTTVTNRAQLQAIDTSITSHVAGAFGSGQFAFAYDQAVGSTSFYNDNPYLHEMTSTALDILDNNSNGFFLLVENELTDAAGHAAVLGASKLERSMYEVRELSRAVQKAIDFAAAHPDTLILVTSDHETGSFNLLENNGLGVVPTVASGGTSHNATWVPLYASGPNSERVFGKLDNTDLSRVVAATSPPAPAIPLQTATFRQGSSSYTGVVDSYVRSDQPSTSNGSAPTLLSDVGSPTAQIMIRFDDVFGELGLPADAVVVLAKISVYTGDASNSDGTNNNINLNRLLVGFGDTTTWDSAGLIAGNGFSLNGSGDADDDYLALAEDVFPAPERGAIATFDVTQSVMAWLRSFRSGEAHSHGWLLTTSSTDGWQAYSSEALLLASRPMLEITYYTPEPTAPALLLTTAFSFLRRRRRHG